MIYNVIYKLVYYYAKQLVVKGVPQGGVLTFILLTSSMGAAAWYDNTSSATCLFAMLCTTFSYIFVLWMPIPQKIANACQI